MTPKIYFCCVKISPSQGPLPITRYFLTKMCSSIFILLVTCPKLLGQPNPPQLQWMWAMPKRIMLLLPKEYAFTASTSGNVWAGLTLFSLQPSFTDEADETWGYHHKRDHHHHHQIHIYFTMIVNKSTIIIIIITMLTTMTSVTFNNQPPPTCILASGKPIFSASRSRAKTSG